MLKICSKTLHTNRMLQHLFKANHKGKEEHKFDHFIHLRMWISGILVVSSYPTALTMSVYGARLWVESSMSYKRYILPKMMIQLTQELAA